MLRTRTLLSLSMFALLASGCQEDTTQSSPSFGGSGMNGAASAGGADPQSSPDDVEMQARESDAVPVRLQVQIQYEETQAGEPNQITCEVYDADGEQITDLTAEIVFTPDGDIQRTDDGYVAQRAGQYSVSCALPAFDLEGENAADWTVEAAAAHRVTASLSANTMSAGERVEVQCDAEDIYGNTVTPVDGRVRFNPEPSSYNAQTDTTFTIDAAGDYRVACSVPGVAESFPAQLVVEAGPADSLVMTRRPDKNFYRRGELLEMVIDLQDAYGNPLNIDEVQIVTDPSLTALNPRRFELDQIGTFTIDALYDGATTTGGPLAARTQIFVDDGGPTINCLEPAFGAQLLRPAEGRLTLTGTVSDTAGVDSVAVNGELVAIDEQGNFSVNVDVEWGINANEVAAVDVNGERSSTLCSFFAADSYHAGDTLLENAVQLRINQDALDDGEGSRPFDSVADVIRTVIASETLIEVLNNNALAQNPIVPVECRFSFLGACVFRGGANFESIAINGERTASLQLIEGGMAVTVDLNDIELAMQVLGSVNTRGTVQIPYIRTRVEFDVGLGEDGSAQVQLRNVDGPHLGAMTSDFEGVFSGRLIESMVWIARVFSRDSITNSINGVIEDQLRAGLAEFFSNLSFSGLSRQVEVPSMADGESTQLTLVSQLSEIQFTPEAALIAASVRVDAEIADGYASLGFPVPNQAQERPLVSGQASAAIDIAFVNMVLHRLWRSGYFDRELGQAVAGFADGFEGVELDLQLPVAPAIEGIVGDGSISLHLGPLVGVLVAPQFGPDPFTFKASVRVNASAQLDADNGISFGPIVIDELMLAIEGASFGSAQRAELDRVLSGILQEAVNTILERNVPALPIPVFTTPEAFSAFGVEEGTMVGVRQANLSSTVRTLFASGRFGELPTADAEDGDDAENPDEEGPANAADASEGEDAPDENP